MTLWPAELATEALTWTQSPLLVQVRGSRVRVRAVALSLSVTVAQS